MKENRDRKEKQSLKRNLSVSLNFTLIELLIVIAIIAIIAAMLLPSLNHARQSAMKVSCLNNQKSIGTGLIMYANTYQFFPMTTSSSAGELGYHWYQKIFPEITGKNASSMDGKTWEEVLSSKWGAKCYWCPAYRLSRKVNFNKDTIPYGLNTNFNNARIERIKYLSRMVLLGDSNEDGSMMYMLDTGYYLLGGERHNGQSNLIFGDGHAATGKALEYHRRPSTVWGTMNYETGANVSAPTWGSTLAVSSPYYQFMRITWSGID